MKLESKPSNVRLPVQLKHRIEALARRNNLSSSDIIRLMLFRAIPQLEAGRFLLVAEQQDCSCSEEQK